MKKFEFFIGSWSLKYTVPESFMSPATTGEGTGTHKRALNDQYVFFDYKAQLTTGSAKAHGIFAKDKQQDLYRYWWFEDSGSFMTATCQFQDDNTLFMNWHDSLLIQTFEKITDEHIMLKMSNRNFNAEFEPVLIVDFSKK